MPYSKNPYLPKVRAQAVKLVKAGKGIRLAARHFGVEASTVSRWVKRAGLTGLSEIPTRSSRPKNPRTISREIAERVIKLRSGFGPGEIAKKLRAAGIKISMSSIKRIVKK